MKWSSSTVVTVLCFAKLVLVIASLESRCTGNRSDSGIIEEDHVCNDDNWGISESMADTFKPSATNTPPEILEEYRIHDESLHSFLASKIPAALEHTGATGFDDHLRGVQAVLRYWNASQDLTNAGLFHSIYGTEGFQGYSLPLSYRGQIRDFIGERAERLCWIFCMVDRYSVDTAVFRDSDPTYQRSIVSRPELGRFPIVMSDVEWYEFVELTLADWLEQVEGASQKANPLFRWETGEAWAYRRTAYRSMAQLLKSREPSRLAAAEDMLKQVYAIEPLETRKLVQNRTPPMSSEAERAFEALRSAGERDIPTSWRPV